MQNIKSVLEVFIRDSRAQIPWRQQKKMKTIFPIMLDNNTYCPVYELLSLDQKRKKSICARNGKYWIKMPKYWMAVSL